MGSRQAADGVCGDIVRSLMPAQSRFGVHMSHDGAMPLLDRLR